MTSWENEGLEYQRLGQWCEGSRPVVIRPLNSLFILLEYFQKYLYLSSFKLSTFLLLLKYLFWSVLCTSLHVVFWSVTKLLLDYNIRVLFTPLITSHPRSLAKTVCSWLFTNHDNLKQYKRWKLWQWLKWKYCQHCYVPKNNIIVVTFYPTGCS